MPDKNCVVCGGVGKVPKPVISDGQYYEAEWLDCPVCGNTGTSSHDHLHEDKKEISFFWECFHRAHSNKYALFIKKYIHQPSYLSFISFFALFLFFVGFFWFKLPNNISLSIFSRLMIPLLTLVYAAGSYFVLSGFILYIFPVLFMTAFHLLRGFRFKTANKING